MSNKVDAKERVLSQFDFFSGLDDRARQEIAFQVQERTFEAGQIIVFAGDRSEAVYLIVKGEARAERLSLEGREYVLDHIGPGQLFNLVPALDGGVNLATVQAVTETTVYYIPCDRFRQLVNDHRGLAMAVLQYMASTARALCDAVEDLALYPVRARLARFLLSRRNNGRHSPVYWTQEEIAAHIGTVRDVVGRTLRSFSEEGLVRRQRGRLMLADPAGLRHVAMSE